MSGASLDETGLILGSDGQRRCWWPGSHGDYIHYHDQEWGFPIGDDQRLFEKICLEGFQSGLSWLTILRKRDNFRRAFDQFDFVQVARYGHPEVERLMQDGGIVRHRPKVESTINNARRAGELVEEWGSLAAFFWRYVPPEQERPQRLDRAAIATLSKTPTSIALAQALKDRGWSFVGPTTAYAFMQSVGIVNDHVEGCDRRPVVEQARQHFLAQLPR